MAIKQRKNRGRSDRYSKGVSIKHSQETEAQLEEIKVQAGLQRSAFNSISDGFFLLDAIREDTGEINDFVVRKVNENGAAMVSLPKEVIVGKSLRELFPIATKTEMFRDYAMVVETGKSMETRFPLGPAENGSEPRWNWHQVSKLGDGIGILACEFQESRPPISSSLDMGNPESQALVESHVGSWEIDFYTKNIRGSDKTRQNHGLTAGAAPDGGNSFLDVLHPEDRPRIQEAMEGAFLKEDPFDCSYRVLRPDGEERTMNARGQVIRDEQGHPLRLVGTVLDITEQKSAENKIKESEERFRNLIEGSIQGIVVHRDFKPLFVNQAFADMFGYSLEELMAMKSLNHLIHQEDLADILEERARRKTEGKDIPSHHSYRACHRDGDELHISCFAREVVWDGETAIQATLIDVTKQKNAERELHESRTLLKAIYDHLPLEVFVKDTDGRFMMVNRKFAETAKVPAEKWIGRKFEEMTEISIDPDEISLANESDRQVLEKKESLEMPKRTFIDSEGNFVYARTIKAPILDADGNVTAIIGILENITTRILAEKKIRKNEEFLRMVVENSPVILFAMDAKGMITLSEGKGLERQGFRPGEVVGISIFDVYHDYPEFLSKIRIALEGNSIQTINETIGGIYQRYLEPVKDESGKVTGLIGVSVDISDQMKAEEALRESQQLLQTVVDNVPQAIFVKDLNGKYKMANKAMGKVFGLMPKDVMGKQINELPGLIQSEIEEMMEQDRRVIDSRQSLDIPDACFTRYDGIETWRHIYKAPLFDSLNTVTGVIAISEDITERKKAQEDLKSHKALLQGIFDAIPARIKVTDAKGWPMLSNKSEAERYGMSPEKVIKGTENYPNLKEEDVQEVKTQELAVVKNGESFDYIRTRELLDRTVEHDHVIRVPLRDTAGNITGGLHVIYDVSEHKILEMQLRQAQKMEAVGQLAAGVAHDFNNMLQIIQGYGELALIHGQDGGDLTKDLEKILSATNKASNLTRQLLAFGRKQVMRPQNLDLNQVIEHLMKMVRRLIGENILLKIIPGDFTDPVHGDPGMLEQVILNLCVNARDAMPEGGQLVIETKMFHADLKFCRTHDLDQPGKYVLISVSDKGCGIAPENLQHIFDPFFTTKKVGEGTGLGLSVVFGIIKQHQGVISVFSEPGLGTTFDIYLPMSGNLLKPEKESETSKPIVNGNETILVAEDEEEVLDLVKRILKKHGYTVLSALDGKEACAIFSEQADSIDLVILDVIMPNMGGKDVYDHIRQIKPDVPVLFSTGYSGKALDSALLSEDNVILLNKPFSPGTFLGKVREELDKTEMI